MKPEYIPIEEPKMKPIEDSEEQISDKWDHFKQLTNVDHKEMKALLTNDAVKAVHSDKDRNYITQQTLLAKQAKELLQRRITHLKNSLGKHQIERGLTSNQIKAENNKVENIIKGLEKAQESVFALMLTPINVHCVVSRNQIGNMIVDRTTEYQEPQSVTPTSEEHKEKVSVFDQLIGKKKKPEKPQEEQK